MVYCLLSALRISIVRLTKDLEEATLQHTKGELGV